MLTDYRHPIVRKFRDHPDSGLIDIARRHDTSRSSRWKRSRLSKCPTLPKAQSHRDRSRARVATCRPPGSPAEVVLALSNGDPLIVAQPVRRGRVVLVTTSADASWGDLPRLPTYEPLVKEILAWCTAGQAQPRNVEVGDPLESALAASPALAGRVDRASRAPAQRRTVPLEVQGDYSTWRYDDTLISGIYTAHFGSPLGRQASSLRSTW